MTPLLLLYVLACSPAVSPPGERDSDTPSRDTAEDTGLLVLADHHVAVDGDDGGAGTAEDPWATLQHAVDQAEPGDLVVVGPGVYDGAAITVSGTADAPITLTAVEPGTVVLDGQDSASYGLTVEGAGHWVIEGLEIRNFAWTGVFTWGHHLVLRGNHIHHIGNREESSSYGIAGVYQAEEATGDVFDGNRIHDVGRSEESPSELLLHDHGFYLCGDDTLVSNNLLHDLDRGWAIHVAGYDTVSDLRVVNNTIVRGGYHVMLWQDLSGVLIQNNLFLDVGVSFSAVNFSITGRTVEGVTVQHNLAWPTAVADACEVCTVVDNTTGVDPLLLDKETPAVHLSADSPAIDAGHGNDAPDADYDWEVRPQGNAVDLGADEAG